MPWLDLIGWSGSALLIYSVMQARVLRFRVLNLAASAILGGFNAALEIWPMVAMNAALCLINAWHIHALARGRHNEDAYQVLDVDPRDAYLNHVLRVHAADIVRFQPDFTWDRSHLDISAFLVLRADETVGVVILRDVGDGVAHVILDYVTPRFRDFSPGEFVWRRSRVLRDLGITRVITAPKMVGAYYERFGFTRRDDGAYEREL